MKNDLVDITFTGLSIMPKPTPTIEMVPVAYFYVYYMDNGFMRSNDIKIIIDNEFENKVWTYLIQQQ